jgi:hypothetical protein
MQRFPECGEHLSFEEFSSFAHSVWSDLDRRGPLLVTGIEMLSATVQLHEFRHVDASARWAFPPADSLGVPRTGSLAGTSGPVAYLDVRREARQPNS